MTKYMKNSIKKVYKNTIINKEKLSQILHGLKGELAEEPVRINHDILLYDETIKSMILFYYNAYPEDVLEIFKDMSLNNKSIQQLIDEYSMKIAEERSEKTDFETLLENSDNNPKIEILKEKVIEHFFEKLPEMNTLYFSDQSIEIMPSTTIMFNGFKSNYKENNEIVYWTNEDLIREDKELNIYKFMDKIRNAIMHNRIDVQHVEGNNQIVEPQYSFQDNLNNNSNFIVTHINSLQLQAILLENEKILRNIRSILELEKTNDDYER